MKEHELEKIEKMEKLMAEVESNPEIIRQRKQVAEEVLAKRKAAAARIEDLKIEIEACGVIQGEIDELIKHLADLEKEKEKVKNQISQKRAFMWHEKSGAEGAIRGEEEILLSSYDPSIDEAIDFFRQKLDWLRSPGRISHNAAGSERNIFTEKIKYKDENNVAAIKDTLRYCQKSIQDIEVMKLSPEVDLQRIEEMKKGIPDINIYQEYEGEKPMPKGPDGSFLAKVWKDIDANIEWLLKKRI